MPKRSIEISFPKLAGHEAGAFANSLGQHMARVDLGESEITTVVKGVPEVAEEPAVILQYNPASTPSLSAAITDWQRQSRVDSIQVKLSDGRTLEKGSHFPDDDFSKELL